MRKIQEIIVHCTATKAGRDVSVVEIDVWHKGFGWKGIGYHYVVMLDGTVVSGRGENEVGTHCKGKNATSIGVVYVGGLDGNGAPCDTRTPAQKTALRNLLIELLRKHPSARVYGHCDFAAKACPCFDARTEYADLNRAAG